MKARWMIAGSFLTLVALALIVVLGGVALAQPGADDATPEPSTAEDSAKETLRFGAHLGGAWHHVDFDGFDFDDIDPLARVADIIGISTDELKDALVDGQTLADVAEANGMARGELVDALLAEAEDGLALAVEADLLDEEQLAFVREWMTDVVELVVDHPLPPGVEEGWKAHTHDWRDLIDAEDFDLPARLAELLGLTLEELEGAVLDGASLAEIAEANGVDPQTVVDFLVAEAGAELDEAVAAGYLTEDQAQVLRGWVEDGVARFIDNPLMLPNLSDLVARLGTRFGSHFDPFLDDVDWENWADFDWKTFVGQDPLSVAADVVGISHGELLEAMMDGQSLAEIAEAHGVDPQAVVDAQAEQVEALLDDLAAQGLIPQEVPDWVDGHLGQGFKMLAEHGFPFGEWDHGDAPWMEWFDCCPCDQDRSGE